MTIDVDLNTINEAIYLRGLFIQRYSGIEFALTDLILRATVHDAYSAFGDLPWKFDSKLDRLRALIDADGPIKAYKAEIVSTFGDFAAFSAQRHFQVHAIMTPQPKEDGVVMLFRMYDHKKVTDANGNISSKVHVGDLEATLDQMRAMAEALQPMSTGFTALVARICREVPLPPEQ